MTASSVASGSRSDFGTAGGGGGGGMASDRKSSVAGDPAEKLKMKVQNTRIALSKQGARFQLPIDMKKMEDMTPQQYLIGNCIVTKRRENLYRKHFFAHDKDKDQKLNIKELDKAMKDVFVDTIDSETVNAVRILVGIKPTHLVTFPIFSTMCALSERIMYHKFSTGEASLDPSYSQKERLEEADFSGLDWKLHGVQVSDQLRLVLNVILDPIANMPADITQLEEPDTIQEEPQETAPAAPVINE